MSSALKDRPEVAPKTAKAGAGPPKDHTDSDCGLQPRLRPCVSVALETCEASPVLRHVFNPVDQTRNMKCTYNIDGESRN